MVVAHGTLNLRNASKKNCSGEWMSCPLIFFNTSLDAGKASKLPDLFLQENFDLEDCQRYEKLRFLEIFVISFLNLFESRVSLESLFFPLELTETYLLNLLTYLFKFFSFITHINFKSGYTTFFSLQILI